MQTRVIIYHSKSSVQLGLIQPQQEPSVTESSNSSAYESCDVILLYVIVDEQLENYNYSY